ncbi:hypothetical protein LXL04_011439 [Taraxacum kok-saghyz]
MLKSTASVIKKGAWRGAYFPKFNLTVYPQARKILDYEARDLQKIYSGAKVYYGGGFHTVADPLRHLADAIQSLTNPIGTIVDKSLFALNRIRPIAPKSQFKTQFCSSTTLVSVSLIGLYEDVPDEELKMKVVEELSGWFGFEEEP